MEIKKLTEEQAEKLGIDFSLLPRKRFNEKVYYEVICKNSNGSWNYYVQHKETGFSHTEKWWFTRKEYMFVVLEGMPTLEHLNWKECIFEIVRNK